MTERYYTLEYWDSDGKWHKSMFEPLASMREARREVKERKLINQRKYRIVRVTTTTTREVVATVEGQG